MNPAPHFDSYPPIHNFHIKFTATYVEDPIVKWKSIAHPRSIRLIAR